MERQWALLKYARLLLCLLSSVKHSVLVFFLNTPLFASLTLERKKWHARYCFIIVRALLFRCDSFQYKHTLGVHQSSFWKPNHKRKTLTRHQIFLQTLEISIALSAFPSLGLTQVIYRFPVSKAKIRSARPTRFILKNDFITQGMWMKNSTSVKSCSHCYSPVPYFMTDWISTSQST